MQLDRKAKSNQLATTAKSTLRRDIREALDSGPSDSSAAEDVEEPSAAKDILGHLQEEDLLEPYQVSGQTILSDAISKAVENIVIPQRKKPIVEETRKLVEEYEIITRESEIATGYLADDDFELVDHDHARL